ncbi:hypothetical protein [Rugamonas aquatica]|uniref:hypothetical protein n=1 Tax=Rugamonas aquatica TaxID=2743357 RepID=UPI001583E60D|nr:hypothetical protein [Rugamonas aquatica]
MNNRHLTAENAFNGAGFNKMPNPQAKFLPNKIKYLQQLKFKPQALLRPLEKYFSVHK